MLLFISLLSWADAALSKYVQVGLNCSQLTRMPVISHFVPFNFLFLQCYVIQGNEITNYVCR